MGTAETGKIASHGRRLQPVQDAVATRRAVNPLSYVFGKSQGFDGGY
jgi:hypothetical protein